MSTVAVDVSMTDEFSAMVDRLGYDIACLAVNVEAAGRELERLRLQRVRDRAALGLPIESVPAGKRLVATGIVSRCCDCHGGSCPFEPCCADCVSG